MIPKRRTYSVGLTSLLLAWTVSFVRKFTPRLRHRYQSSTIALVLGALREAKAFRRVLAVCFCQRQILTPLGFVSKRRCCEVVSSHGDLTRS